MLKTARLACAAALVALPAAAFDPGAMSPSERAAFGDAVRGYLLENPEVLTEAIGVLEAREAAAQAEADVALVADNAAALFDDPGAFVAGNPDGDLTMVEFLDYRCGYCRRAHPEVAELVASDGDIRLIVKEFPILGEESLMASRFALAVRAVAGDDAYAAANDTLMTSPAAITEGSLRALAEALDLDADAVLAAMDDPEIDAIIARNRALGQTLGINGTPSFVFGDRMVRGYVPLDAMEAIVAEERAEG